MNKCMNCDAEAVSPAAFCKECDAKFTEFVIELRSKWRQQGMRQGLSDKLSERSQVTAQPQTHTANTEDWLTHGQKIVAYVQRDVPTVSVSGRSLSSKITESLERSLTEHASVWAELARY